MKCLNKGGGFLKTCNYSWIEFLSGRNVIKVTNEDEFKMFKSFLKECGLLEILNKEREFSDWESLAVINNKQPDIFLFEYNNHKGLTWWDNIKEAIDWYGIEPIEISDLQEFFERKDSINEKDISPKSEQEIEYDI